jgi:flagellar basal body rod protein FlgC
MYDQSISGIRSNLEAFSQAAAKIAQPQATDVLAGSPDKQSSPTTGPRLSLTPADQTAAKKASTAQTTTKARNPNAPKETANDPGTRSKASPAVDQPQETVNMMVAQRGVEANIRALKTAMSVNILA